MSCFLHLTPACIWQVCILILPGKPCQMSACKGMHLIHFSLPLPCLPHARCASRSLVITDPCSSTYAPNTGHQQASGVRYLAWAVPVEQCILGLCACQCQTLCWWHPRPIACAWCLAGPADRMAVWAGLRLGPGSLRACRDGAQVPPGRALQCHRPSRPFFCPFFRPFLVTLKT